MTARVAVLGASGYTGQEVLRLLARHPGMTAAAVMSARRDGSAAATAPFATPIAPLDLDALAGLDGAFVCAPHGASAPLVVAALERGLRVVDLSADFRLESTAAYRDTYGAPHPAPELLGEAVYGLTERARAALVGARLVANPGCYPTSILLPLLPLLDADLIDLQAPVVADAKSGVSGAGKTPSDRTLYGNVHDNFQAYAVGNHRHTPEIAQFTAPARVVFVPHLLPTFRGMLTTLYLRPRTGRGAADVLGCLREAYAGEPFVRVYPEGLPDLTAVVHGNTCDVGVAAAAELVVVVSALDNLVKGAAGQAVQNMNLLLGLPEAEGLR